MGLLVNGDWVDRWYDTESSGGRFERQESRWRHQVSAEAPAGDGPHFPVSRDRYHLYVAWACPWAHRTLLARKLLGLEAVLPTSVVAPEMLDKGWVFDDAHPDRLYGLSRLSELYTRDTADATTRVTVPVLWDTVQQRIVNNESSEIIRMFWGAFAPLQRPDAPLAGHDLRPAALADELDAVNQRVYDTVNNGVYRAGFATTQEAYEEAVEAVFASLDWLEARLSTRRWLVGDRFTEADLRLFPTLFRFDAVYHGHFKCSRRQLQQYPALWAYTRDIYQLPGVAETLNLAETRRHYYHSHDTINPHRIVPVAPDLDFSQPHARAQLGSLRGDPTGS